MRLQDLSANYPPQIGLELLVPICERGGLNCFYQRLTAMLSRVIRRKSLFSVKHYQPISYWRPLLAPLRYVLRRDSAF